MSDDDRAPVVPFEGAVDEPQFRRVMVAMLPKWARWYILTPFFIAVLITATTGWAKVVASPDAALANVVLGFIVTAICHVATRLQFQRSWISFERLHGSVAGEVGPDGIAWKTDASSTRLGWDKIIGYRYVGDDLALVHYSARGAFFLPRSFLAGEAGWAALREALERYSKPL